MGGSFMNTFFGPLPREYCIYFYFLSIIFGVMFVLLAISITFFVITNYKRVNKTFILNSFFTLLNTFIAYFVNRLLNTMCMKAI
jgi:hypothetical protein